MFGGKNKNTRRPIGVAVGTTEVVLAQAGPTGAGDALLAAARAPLPEDATPGSPGYDAQLAEAIGRALKQGPFVGKSVVSAMPAESLQYKNIRLPKMPEPELAQAVAWEAKERVVLGERASVQFYYAGEVRQGQDIRCEVILLASKQSRVDEHLRGIVGAGLTPTAIDATGAALARSVFFNDTATTEIYTHPAHVEVVIAQGGRVLLAKLLPVSEHTAQDPTELAREIGLCLRYHSVTFRGEKPARVELRGNPLPAGVADAITSALGLAVSETGEQGLFAIAAGLSLRERDAEMKRGAA